MEPAPHIPLALPAQTTSAQLPAAPEALKVTGNNPQTVAAIESALKDPILTHAITIAFRGSPTHVEVSATRGRTTSCVQRGTKIAFEHKSTGSKIVDEFKREIFRQASCEMLLVATESYVRTGALADSHLHDLKSFIGLGFKVGVDSESELKEAIAKVLKDGAKAFNSDKDHLLKRIEKASRKRLHSVEEARGNIEHLGNSTRTALAISLLIDSKEDRSRTVDRLAAAVAEVRAATEHLWQKNLFLGERTTVEKTIELFSLIKTAFRTPGFNAPKPRVFPNEETRATIEARALLATNTTSAHIMASSGRPFSPCGLTDIAEVVRETTATLAFDQELRAWKVGDDDIVGFLNERILDIIPKLPQAITTLEREKPSRIPEELAVFIESLCLLRLHGGTDGLVRFGRLACQLTPDEKVNFINDPARYVAAHPADYSVLVEFLATWPLKTSEFAKLLVLDAILPLLRILAASEIYNMSKSFEDSSLKALTNQREITGPYARAFLAHVRGLGHAAKAMGNSSLLSCVAPTTRAIRRFLLTRVVADMPPERRLRHITTLDTLLTQQRTEATAQPQGSGPLSELLTSQAAFVDAVIKHIDENHSRLLEQLDEFAKQLESTFSTLCDQGDVGAFNRLLKQASRLIPLVRTPEIAARATSATNTFSIKLTNLLREGAASELEEGVARFVAEPNGFAATQLLLEKAVAYLPLLYSLRHTFTGTSFSDKAVRVNHIDAATHFIRSSVASTLLARQDKFAQYLDKATDLIRRNVASRDVRELANEALLVPVGMKDLNGTCKEAYRAFQRALGRFNR